LSVIVDRVAGDRGQDRVGSWTGSRGIVGSSIGVLNKVFDTVAA